MSEDVLINVHPFETRVALLQDGLLREVHLQRAARGTVAGNVYRGRVVRVLPGMQAAFVDIGLERPGFLHARDVRDLRKSDRPQTGSAQDAAPPIERLLREGGTVVVQVLKDPLAAKGARLGMHLALPSRYLVLMPFSEHVGVSQRIDDADERARLRSCIETLRERAGTRCGFIVRTVADGATEAQLAADLAWLERLWSGLGPCVDGSAEAGVPSRAAPALIYEDLPAEVRVLRDLVTSDVARVRIDCADTHAAVVRFVERFLPELRERVMLHDEATPLFERFGVEADLAQALSKRVALKCGGHLVIEQTEAMTTIDVNSGGFVAGASHEEIVYRTNLEAAAAIPRQLRLRNLGGIVVIDFIDMEDAEHRRQVLRAFAKAAESDPARMRIGDFSALGLVELSRKRTRESLIRLLCAPCAACDGTGVARAADAVALEVLRRIADDAARAAAPPAAWLVRAAQAVLDRLLDDEADDVAALADRLGVPIRLQLEPCYGVDEFDVVRLRDPG